MYYIYSIIIIILTVIDHYIHTSTVKNKNVLLL